MSKIESGSRVSMMLVIKSNLFRVSWIIFMFVFFLMIFVNVVCY